MQAIPQSNIPSSDNVTLAGEVKYQAGNTRIIMPKTLKSLKILKHLVELAEEDITNSEDSE